MESLENIAERISTTKKSLEEHPRQNLEIAIKELLEISKELDLVKNRLNKITKRLIEKSRIFNYFALFLFKYLD